MGCSTTPCCSPRTTPTQHRTKEVILNRGNPPPTHPAIITHTHDPSRFCKPMPFPNMAAPQGFEAYSPKVSDETSYSPGFAESPLVFCTINSVLLGIIHFGYNCCLVLSVLFWNWRHSGHILISAHKYSDHICRTNLCYPDMIHNMPGMQAGVTSKQNSSC